MRRLGVFGLVAAVAMASPAAVFALSQSSIPAKFGLAWGQNAGAPYIRSIPQTSQIGIQNCAASLNDGFPPLTFTPSTAGGCPPFGQDFNGILKQLSQWAQWQSAGGPVFYDSGFASTVGGYPKGAIISSAVTPGTQWMSTADSNTTNPDASTANQVVGGTGWVQAPGQVPVGTPLQSFSSTAPTGYVVSDSGTIGNASSNATGRANADTQFLFAFLWNNCSNTVCPLKTSGGSPASRGATAAADFAANTAISTPLMQGADLVAVDSGGTTFLSAAPVTSGSTTTTASIIGENTHLLTRTEIPTGITSTVTGVNSTVSGVNSTVSGVTIDAAGAKFVVTSSTPSNVSINFGGGGQGIVPDVSIGQQFTFPTSLTGGSGTAAQTGTGTAAQTGTGSATSNNTGGGAHNIVSRAFTVKWNLKL